MELGAVKVCAHAPTRLMGAPVVTVQRVGPTMERRAAQVGIGFVSLCASTHACTRMYTCVTRRGRVPERQRRLRQQTQMHQDGGILQVWRLPSWVYQRRGEGLQRFVRSHVGEQKYIHRHGECTYRIFSCKPRTHRFTHTHYLSIYRSIYVSIGLSIFLSIYLFTYLSIFLSISS